MKISEAMKLLEGYGLLLVILGLAILAASALPRLFAHRPASLPMALISAPVIGYLDRRRELAKVWEVDERPGRCRPQSNLTAGPVRMAAVDNGEKCNFGSVFETNGRIPELGLRLLDDDEGFFAAYNPSLTMRAETLEQYSELAEIFAPISERLDTEALRGAERRRIGRG